MIHKTIQLSSATLTTYIIDNSEEMDPNRERPAVIICPGGGYEFLSDRETEPIAIAMMAQGFQAFVLRYSVKPAVFPTALVELANAVQYVRSHHESWHIDSQKIIVSGFSAGGHLAASLGVFWNDTVISNYLEGAATTWQPNGMLLAYPVLLSDDQYGHQDSFRSLLAERYPSDKEELSLDRHVSSITPPTFLWHTLEDGLVPAESSMRFAEQLRYHSVPFELHLFPKGGHGLSLGTEETMGQGGYGVELTVQQWPTMFAQWVKNNV